MRLYQDRLGIKKFLEFDSSSMDASAPHPVRVALAWTGNMQVELIEPVGEPSALYASALPDDGSFSTRLHHIGHMVRGDEAWRSLKRELASDGHRIAEETSVPDLLDLMYVDLREVDGLYREYVFPGEAGEEFLMKQVPQN
jgi:hypothetical protein